MVIYHADDLGVDALKHLASALRAHPGMIALLAMTANGKMSGVFARAADIDLHMGDLLRTTLQRFGGGGGGRPDFAQGGGIAAEDRQAFLDHAAERVRTAVAAA